MQQQQAERDPALQEEQEEEEEGIHDPNFVWSGVCLDDGTGRDVYYMKRDGSQRQRKVPHGYRPEYLDNGERKYYYRKVCIRCRKVRQPPIFLSHGSGGVAFSINYCDDCHIATTPGITRMRGNGRLIWKTNEDTPKSAWFDLKKRCMAVDRNALIHARAVDARLCVRQDMKFVRNRQRTNTIRELALSYECDVREGSHLSWGFEDTYDEYFGQVRKSAASGELQPHGWGVKIYSDGTVYFGGWANGEYHTEPLWKTGEYIADVKGNLIKPTGATYEGQWVQGQKHGLGLQIYPDGGRYEGEFAKGFEHGQGKKSYADGSIFEGRFRFGRKDGPGTFTDRAGKAEKGTFLDPTEKYNEKAPPFVTEELNPNEEYQHPLSLRELSLQSLAWAMHHNRKVYGPASKLQRMVPEHLKYSLGQEYLRIMEPKGSESFMKIGPDYAFNFLDEVIFKSVKIIEADAQALMYFQNSNLELKVLRCTANKMTLPSIDLICKNLQAHAWPRLSTLDLSFNLFDVSALAALLAGISQIDSLRSLSLRACGIRSQGAAVIAQAMCKDKQVEVLDLAFNNLELMGAEQMAGMLRTNKTIRELNMRSNSLGVLGAQALAGALSANKSLRVLVLADNVIGGEMISVISGKLNGNFRDVLTSSRSWEVDMPTRYAEGRYDRKKGPKDLVEEQSDSD